jgi:hypothetical protein
MKIRNVLTIIVVCVMIYTLCIAGCIQQRPDPETGVKYWISEVNNHDLNGLYDLAPKEIRQQITRQDFIAAQNNNSLIVPGNIIGNYQVLNRTVEGNNAALTVMFVMHSPGSSNVSPTNIPVYIKYIEVFEDSEWKVWTTSP